jgi:hypothetical protein
MCPSHAFGPEESPFGADELALGPIRSISPSDPIRRAGGTLRISPISTKLCEFAGTLWLRGDGVEPFDQNLTIPRLVPGGTAI